MRSRRHNQDPAQRGFTLIELMIAVAIVAILAGVAVFAYIKHIHAGRIVEGKAFLALIQGRQEQYFQTHGNYCDASGSGAYPVLITGEPANKEWKPGTSTGWMDLGARPKAGYTYFRWDVRASSSTNKHALFGEAAAMGIPTQPTSGGTPHPWYYVLGEADFDGNGTPYTTLTASSTRSQVITLNEGK